VIEFGWQGVVYMGKVLYELAGDCLWFYFTLRTAVRAGVFVCVCCAIGHIRAK
jgi:hypothetical protein